MRARMPVEIVAGGKPVADGAIDGRGHRDGADVDDLHAAGRE